jgi:hypothetical protein
MISQPCVHPCVRDQMNMATVRRRVLSPEAIWFVVFVTIMLLRPYMRNRGFYILYWRLVLRTPPFSSWVPVGFTVCQWMTKIRLLLFLSTVILLHLSSHSFPRVLRISILCTCPVQKINGKTTFYISRLAMFQTSTRTHPSFSSRTRECCHW